MEFMRTKPDKFYDLAIVDPPYNVGASDGNFGGKKEKPSRINGKLNGKHYANHDKTPDAEYFDELFRISTNQIIWGSNYYPQYLRHSGAIIWDKLTTGPLSDCEIAFQSFNKLVIKYTHAWTGFNKGGDKSIRVHPNQKPIDLYRWTLREFAKPNDKILDTHGGSMSIAIACDMEGFDLDICEIDKEYFDAGVKRFNEYKRQLTLF
jgi:site-specific DNA-methyltransferase (adenine-specific)